jgi:RND family efflux transporter MFP subunit
MKLNKKLITGISGGILAVVVIVLISAAGARKKEAAKHENAAKMALKNAPRPVRFEKVTAAPLEKRRVFPGIVRAAEESELSFRVGGPLTEVNVMLGEPVSKGDLLMRIDPRDFKDRIISLEAQLNGAVAIHDNAKQDFSRIAKLFDQKVVPQSDYDRARSMLDSSEATVETVKAQLQIARHALDDTELRAPYDGTVSAQMVENFEMIKAGQVVMHYQNVQTLEIIVNIPENEMVNAPVQTENVVVKVSFPSLPGKIFAARVKEWSTTADPLTRTYSTTFALDAPEGFRVLPGMTARVELSQEKNQVMVITVPFSALVTDEAGGSSVWIYDEAMGTAESRSVVLGPLNGPSRIVITDGLSEGELVVVTGSRLIHGNLPLKTASIR